MEGKGKINNTVTPGGAVSEGVSGRASRTWPQTHGTVLWEGATFLLWAHLVLMLARKTPPADPKGYEPSLATWVPLPHDIPALSHTQIWPGFYGNSGHFMFESWQRWRMWRTARSGDGVVSLCRRPAKSGVQSDPRNTTSKDCAQAVFCSPKSCAVLYFGSCTPPRHSEAINLALCSQFQGRILKRHGSWAHKMTRLASELSAYPGANIMTQMVVWIFFLTMNLKNCSLECDCCPSRPLEIAFVRVGGI